MCVCVCVCVYGTVISKTVLKSVHVISTNFTSTFTVCITGNAVVPVKPCEHAQVGPNWDYDILLCHEGGSKDFATKISCTGSQTYSCFSGQSMLFGKPDCSSNVGQSYLHVPFCDGNINTRIH